MYNMSAKSWTKEELDYLRENYQTMTANQIAVNLGRTKHAVQLKANRIGIKLEKKYYYDKNYFEEITTPNQAYWLGFFYADGYVIKTKANAEAAIELQKSDAEHLRKLNNCIGGNVEVGFRKRSGGNICGHSINPFEVCFIRFYSSKLVNDLISHGCVQHKSFIKKPPVGVPEEYMRDFIRGYFDGNGSITQKYHRKVDKYYLSVSIETASDDFAQWLSDYLNKHGFSNKNSKDTFAWKINLRTPSNWAFIDYIYKDAEVYLNRKYQRYLNAVSDHSGKFGQRALKGKIGKGLTANSEVNT